MNERLKLLSTEESHKAGANDAETLLSALRNMNEGDEADCLLANTMNGIMALAFENRVEESVERLDGFCAIIGPMLERAAAACLLAETISELDKTIAEAEALGINLTDTEGGEL